MLVPTVKSFDAIPYRELIARLAVATPGREIERITAPIVFHILQGCEGFERVEHGPTFRGTPFDFFGFKGGVPYVVEYKASLGGFSTPGETQKRRLLDLRERIKGLHVALLQVKLAKSQYRIWYDGELVELLKREHVTRAPMNPIVGWVNSRIP